MQTIPDLKRKKREKKEKKKKLSSGLTPGRVFCSCSALWAFRADSLSQYVRKAQPAKKKKNLTNSTISEILLKLRHRTNHFPVIIPFPVNQS